MEIYAQKPTGQMNAPPRKLRVSRRELHLALHYVKLKPNRRLKTNGDPLSLKNPRLHIHRQLNFGASLGQDRDEPLSLPLHLAPQTFHQSMSTLTLASTSRRLSSGRCFCSSSRLLASEPTLSGIPDLSATPNAVESTSGHSGSAAAPSEVPATAEGPAAAGRPGRKGASLNDWLAGEGSKYRRPMNKSTNWLSRTVSPCCGCLHRNPVFVKRVLIADECAKPNSPSP